MVEQIAVTLAAADPGNAAVYQANAATTIAGLEQLTAEVEALLDPVKDAPFVVFHDAYQYFERRFGLTIAGTITVTPDTMPGAARVAEIRERIEAVNAACVFAEPQFEPAIVETIIEGGAARAGVLDPEGGSLTAGPDLYPTLIRNLAASLRDCLSATVP
jgi:zinc transport system substrate-binding protein